MSWLGRRRLVKRWGHRLDAIVEPCEGSWAPALFVRHGRGVCQACERPTATMPNSDGRPGDVALPHPRTEP